LTSDLVSGDAVQLVVEVRAAPGRQQALRAALDRLVETTHRIDPGVVRFEVAVDPVDDTRYVGYEIWASQDALDQHADRPHTRQFLAEARELVRDADGPLQVTHWRPLDTPVRADYRQPPVPPAPPPDGFAHRTVAVDDTTLHYVIGGSGDPVVLLHGFPNTWYAWREVMPILAQRHTVLAVDLRGLGDSTSGDKPNDVPTSAHDLHLLARHLDLGPVAVAGQDWGGSTGYAWARGYPGDVRHLAVLEAMPSGPWTAAGAPRQGAWFAAFHQIPTLPERLVAGREPDYLDWFYTAFSATAGVPGPGAVAEYLRCYRRPGALSSAFARYRGVEREIAHNAAQPTPTIPVLAIGGAQVFGAAVADNLQTAADDLRGIVLDDCGHFVTEERPGEVAALLLDFFGN
jgi:pimeloyl-ACP methyl ester carboxylesterase/quinol monooxygenase YgiN